MEIFNYTLQFIGVIVVSLAFAGLQRIFFPHTAVNAFMDLDKLKAVCPEIFKQNNKDKEN